MDFRQRFSRDSQEAVRKWLNRFLKDGHDHQNSFWRAMERHFETNGTVAGPNDIIWGMLNQRKGPADVGTLLGMCELLMIEKKYRSCLDAAIELTYVQGSGADPVNKALADKMGLIDGFKEFPSIGSACIPYLSICASQLKLAVPELKTRFMTLAERHHADLGKFAPEVSPSFVWKTIEAELQEALQLGPLPPKYRVKEPKLEIVI